jgi:type I restriction enzyme M protein
MKVRAELLESFVRALVPVGLLDRFKISGVVARWWGDVQFDLKTLKARGFSGVVEGWVTTVTTALEDETAKSDPLDHKLVKRLVPDFVGEIARIETQVAELDGTIAAIQISQDGDDSEAGDSGEASSEAELQALKEGLAAARRNLNATRATLVERLIETAKHVSEVQARQLVLDNLKADLRQELARYISAHRRDIITVVERWWDKYGVTLPTIEAKRDAAKLKLDGFLAELGYGN